MKKVYWNYWFGDDHEAKLPDEFMITPKISAETQSTITQNVLHGRNIQKICGW
ncbi:MAG: hypothetical protein CM15mV22_0080 [Eurybiavirus sp.]|nr:MAG: hypothetical protein CM15mV22_0080 [Eurybiavirus sp.]